MKTTRITVRTAVVAALAGIAAWAFAAASPPGGNLEESPVEWWQWIGDENPLTLRAFDNGGSPRATAFGKTFEEWSAEWWQWLRSIPADENPLFMEGEIDCGIGQSSDVWFLAGSAGGPPAVRSCTVPEDTALFFPMINVMFANEPDEDFTVLEKREQLAGLLNLACDMSASIDGVPTVFSLPSVRVQSPPFVLEIIEDDVFGGTAGHVDEEAVSDGYWVMLPPLPPGEHELHFRGAACDLSPKSCGPFFETEVTYFLTVVESDDDDDDDDDDDGDDHKDVGF